MSLYRALLGGVLSVMIVPHFAMAADGSAVFGWQERGLIQPEQGPVDVELDPTSAKSSLTVQNITNFQKNGDDWVRFTVQTTHSLTGSDALTLERKVQSMEKSKGSFGSSSSPRQSVQISLCIGDKVYPETLTLKSHGKGTAAVKLGRDVIGHLGLIDASRMDTVKLNCKG
jgi:hypothetical protein